MMAGSTPNAATIINIMQVVIPIKTACLPIFKVFIDIFLANTMLSIESFKMMISLTSLIAPSFPLCIAIPMSAFAKQGVSFIQSPTIAIGLSSSLIEVIIFNLS